MNQYINYIILYIYIYYIDVYINHGKCQMALIHLPPRRFLHHQPVLQVEHHLGQLDTRPRGHWPRRWLGRLVPSPAQLEEPRAHLVGQAQPRRGVKKLWAHTTWAK